MTATLSEAYEMIAGVQAAHCVHYLPLEQALAEVCAASVEVSLPLPSFDNSAMDGFAVALSDAGKRVAVSRVVLAGENGGSVAPGRAVRIMTGAPLPEGTQAVVPLEEIGTIEEGYVKLPSSIREGAHIRRIGEDLEATDQLLGAYTRISPTDIGLAASQGMTHLPVLGGVRVALIATGSEVCAHYEECGSAKLYNSNTPSLEAFVRSWGCETVLFRVVEDSEKALRRALEAASSYDLIVTTGGASVGDADLTRKIFRDAGAEFLFDKIALKPGKPTAIGHLGSATFIMLPGNPFAAVANFILLGRPLVRRLRGEAAWRWLPVEARMGQAWPTKGGVDTVVAGFFDGSRFWPKAKQAPFMVSALAGCNALAVIAASRKGLQEGDAVRLLLYGWDEGSSERRTITTGEDACLRD